MRIILSILILLLISPSCKKLGFCKDDELKLGRINYTSNELRVNGYYFENSPSSELVSIFYLYKNGVYFDGLAEPFEEAVNSTFYVDVQNSFAKESKLSWGVFKIENNNIEVEKWRASSLGCFSIIKETGIILNDTTFKIILREYRKKGKTQKVEALDITYKFRSLIEKPDSLNCFVP